MKLKKIVCIIQARTGSTRLPAKVLRKIEGKEVLIHVVDRVLNSKLIDLVVVATTTAKNDDSIVLLIEGYHDRVKTFRGSEEDVLDRYYRAAKENSADIIIRITSDCPLTDSEIIDRLVKEFITAGDYDYVSNVLRRRTFPRGIDVEVFSFRVLEHLWKTTCQKDDREHVTWYIKQHPEEFKVKSIENEKDLSELRWTVDEEADIRFVTEVYKRLYRKKHDFKMKDVLEVLNKEPELSKINSDVEQKKVGGKQQ